MSQTALAIWSWIVTQLPTAAVAVGAAYALFKYLGKAWLNRSSVDRLAERLLCSASSQREGRSDVRNRGIAAIGVRSPASHPRTSRCR